MKKIYKLVNTNHATYLVLGSLATLTLISCKKEWLDAKPDKSLVVPSTIADFQAILDNTSNNNGTTTVDFNSSQNSLNELAAADFYVTDDRYNSANPIERNTYVWAQDIYGNEPNNTEWVLPYKRIFYTNIVLEGIEKINPHDANEQQAWDQVKGSALFYRAYNHYDIAQQFCSPYVESSAGSDLGVPIRLTSNFNERSVRASIKDTYEQIINDLQAAKSLLPFTIPDQGSDTILYRVRPNIAAVDAMLARVYLSMSKYDSALVYSNNCLAAYNKLIDFNDFSTTSTTPIGRFNKEVLFHSTLNSWSFLSSSRLIVDSNLYRSYENSDLRKLIFFRMNTNSTTYNFKGSYSSGSILFGGLATNEVFFIRAECNARQNRVTEAMQDINAVLKKRWKNSVPYPTLTATDANDALRKILAERRKELCFRGLRWSDLRRLNKESQLAVALTRYINGQTTTLSPNDDRYVFTIPTDVIQLSGMEQNP